MNASVEYASCLNCGKVGKRKVWSTKHDDYVCETCWLSVVTMEQINALRSEEGDSITLVCDNPDFGGPNCAIEANGAWTNYEDRRFTGETINHCLLAALDAKRRTPPPESAIPVTPVSELQPIDDAIGEIHLRIESIRGHYENRMRAMSALLVDIVNDAPLSAEFVARASVVLGHSKALASPPPNSGHIAAEDTNAEGGVTDEMAEAGAAIWLNYFWQDDEIDEAHRIRARSVCRRIIEAAERARAALPSLEASSGYITVTTNSDGHCVLVSRQDEEGRILKVIWEGPEPPHDH